MVGVSPSYVGHLGWKHTHPALHMCDTPSTTHLWQSPQFRLTQNTAFLGILDHLNLRFDIKDEYVDFLLFSLKEAKVNLAADKNIALA